MQVHKEYIFSVVPNMQAEKAVTTPVYSNNNVISGTSSCYKVLQHFRHRQVLEKLSSQGILTSLTF